MSGENIVNYLSENKVLLVNNHTHAIITFSPEALDLIGYSLKEAVGASEPEKGADGFFKFLESLPAGGMRIVPDEDHLKVIVDTRKDVQSLDKMLIRERPTEGIPIIDENELLGKLRTKRRRDTTSVLRLHEFFGHASPELKESLSDTSYTPEEDNLY